MQISSVIERDQSTSGWWRRSSLPAIAWGFLPIIAIIGLWQYAASNGIVARQILPAPDRVIVTFGELVRDGNLQQAFAISLRRIGFGLGIGVSLGLAFGLWIGISRRADAYLSLIFRALVAIPPLGWIPILIIILGLDESLKIFILAKACFVPMAIAARDAYRGIPVALNELADVLRLRWHTRFFRLSLPAMFPMLFSGFRFAAGQAFVSLVVVEMLAGQDGLGYMMVWGRTLFQIDIVIVGMILVGITGFCLDYILRSVERVTAARSGFHV